MTQFGSYLGQIIAADFEGHRANFAKACGLTPGSMTNYLSKGDLPSPSTMGRIAHEVTDPFKRAELVSAYLADIKAEAKIGDDMEVIARPAAKVKEDPELRMWINHIERHARRDPRYRRILQDIYDLAVRANG